MSKHLIARDGSTIGYNGANFTPLDYLRSQNPRTAIFPKGFKNMLREECPRAWVELCNSRTVFGFRFRDIIEANFEHINKIQERKNGK